MSGGNTKSFIKTTAVALTATCFLYLLSFALVIWASETFWNPKPGTEKILGYVYSPILYVLDKSPAASRLVEKSLHTLFKDYHTL
jgi:hypothetical protein